MRADSSPDADGVAASLPSESGGIYGKLFFAMAQGGYCEDENGLISDVNPAALAMLGLAKRDVVGKSFDQLPVLLVDENKKHVPPGGYPSVAARKSGSPSRDRLIGVYSRELAGYRWLSFNAIPLLAPQARPPYPVFVTIHDETELYRSRQLHAARARLLDKSLTLTLDELMVAALDEAEDLTDSRIGFFHRVGVDETTLTLQAWSTRTTAMFCKAEGKGRHYRVADAGVWADCVRERRALIHNNYEEMTGKKGLPEGHAPVVRELVVPVFKGDRIKAILGVGNKFDPYTEEDVDLIRRLAELAWEVAEKKMLQESITAAEKLLETHLENSPLAIVEFDTQFRISRWSSEAERLFGWTEEEVLGKAIPEFKWVYPEDAVDVGDEAEGLKSGTRPRSIRKNRNYTKTGEVLSCEWYNSGVYNEKGELVSVLSQIVDVTERKRNEEALFKSREHHEAILSAAMDGFWINDLSGRFLRVNKAYCDMIGYSEEELLRMTIANVEARETRDDTAARIRRVCVDGSDRFETKHRRKDGKLIDLEVSIQFHHWDGGMFVVFLRDITGAKQTDASLRESESRLKEAQRIAQLGNWELDLTTGALAWSDEIFRIFELPKESFAPSYEAFLGAIHPEDRETVNAAYSNSLATRLPYDIFHRLLMPDGGIKFVRERCETHFDDAGKPLRSVGTVQDVTYQKLAEEQLHQYFDIVERMQTGLYVYKLEDREDDGSLRLVSANPASTEAIGLVRGEVIGKRIDAIFPKLRDAGIPAKFANVVREGKGFESEEFLYGDDKVLTACFAFKAFPVPGDCVCVLFEDITKRKLAEAEKANLEAQLHQVQKMESIGVLAGGVAHDFNNMLGVILGNTEMALSLLDGQNPLREYLEEIQKAAERSSTITRQLLAFARKQTIIPKVIELDEAISPMLKMLKRLIGEDVELTWKPAGRGGSVRIDPSQLDQILANLATNARDAIVGVGKVVVETGTAVFDKNYCEQHPGYVPGRYVFFSFSDTGCGIDRTLLPSIFEPFVTTKELGKGTGLGLSTVYGIVKQNEGFINVYSEVGHGTTFRVYLPRVKDAAKSAEGAKERNLPGGSETVLLVEDETANLSLMRRALTSLGYKVLAVSDPMEGLRLAEREKDAIKLLITDVIMPGMNGKDLMLAVNAAIPGVRHLFVSGYTASIIADRGVLSEGENFLQKPFTIQELAEKTRKALDG